MFLQNPVIVYSVIAIIVVLAVVLLVAVIPANRRKRSENRFTVEIENLGNVVSSYLLRLEDPGQTLVYSFENQEGSPLITREIAGLPGPDEGGYRMSSSESSFQENAQSANSTIAQFGPSEVSRPIAEVNNEIFAAKTAWGQIGYYLSKVGISIGGSPVSKAGSETLTERWWETERINPGEKHLITLSARRKRAGSGDWPLKVISRSDEEKTAPAEASDEMLQIPAGFWTTPALPEALVIGLGIVMVIIILVLRNSQAL